MNSSKNKHQYNQGIPQRAFHILILVLVASTVVYFFSYITPDPDLWGHIKFGKDLWVSKEIPRVDMYSYTANGMDWVNHEWLTEILMNLTYDTFHSPGLLIGKLLLGFAIIFILYIIILHRRNQPIINGIVLVMCIFVMSPGFMTRPQLLTFLFTALFLLIFHLYLERNVNILWILPLLMILWVNSHGGFIIGGGMFGVVVVSESLSCLLRKNDKYQFGNLIFWFLITIVSVLANPYGFRLLTFLYESLSTPRNISEWERVILFDFSHFRFKILSVSVVLSLLIDKKRNRYWEIGIICITMIYAFMHQRHTPIFAIVAAPFLTEKLSVLTNRSRLSFPLKSKPAFFMLNVCLAVIIAYQLIITTDKYIKTRFNIIVDPFRYPVYAVHFLKINKIRGNILLPFDWGEYAIYKLNPDCKVSIDGRFRTVYPEEVLNDHSMALHNEDRWEYLLDKYPSNILLATRNPFSKKMIIEQQNWVYVYSDNLSIVFLKKGESQKETLKRFRAHQLIYPKRRPSPYFP